MSKKKILAISFGMVLTVGVLLGCVQIKTHAESNLQVSQKNISITAKDLKDSVGQNVILVDSQLKLNRISKESLIHETTSELVSRQKDKPISQEIIIYEDSSKNQYKFSKETGFVGYSTYEFANFLPANLSRRTASSILDSNEVNIEKVQALLDSTIPLSVLIPDFEDYDITEIDSTYGLNISLGKKISSELQDEIFLFLSSNGNIECIATYKPNLTEITDEQKVKFEKKFQDYLKLLQGGYDHYTISGISYKKIENQILANYSVIFYSYTDAEDMKLGDLVTFVIDAK